MKVAIVTAKKDIDNDNEGYFGHIDVNENTSGRV